MVGLIFVKIAVSKTVKEDQNGSKVMTSIKPIPWDVFLKLIIKLIY